MPQALDKRRQGAAVALLGLLALAAGLAVRLANLDLSPTWRAAIALPLVLPGLLAIGLGLRWRFQRNVFGPLLGLVFVYLLFLVLAPDQFHELRNGKTIVTQTVIVGIGALGMTLVVVAGGIDLSVGSMIALTTVVIALVLQWGGNSAGVGVAVLAVLAGVGVAALCGLANGAVSAGLGIVPFIVTLGSMQIVRGLAKWQANSQTVTCPAGGPVQTLQGLMDVDPTPEWLLVAPGVWLLLLLTAGLAFVLWGCVFGRHVYALGSNEDAARLCGVGVRTRRILIYTLCGVFTGVAGVMEFCYLGIGDPTTANGRELDIIAAVVIGGGSLSGGEGGALGSLIGALMIVTLRNGCNILGIPNFVQDIVVGAVIIGAAAVDRIKHRGGH